MQDEGAAHGARQPGPVLPPQQGGGTGTVPSLGIRGMGWAKTWTRSGPGSRTKGNWGAGVLQSLRQG